MNYFDVLFAKKIDDQGDVRVESLTATDNGTYSEQGKAYSPVTVAVPLGTKNITANGTYDATDDSLKGYSSVSVDVPLPENAYLKKDLPTGAIATVTDAEAEVMPSLKIAITPVQEGSGDPSPTNIRPISGWTECNIWRTGKNLFDESILLECSGWTVSDGVYSGESAYVNAKYSNGVPNLAFKPNTQYTFSLTYGQDGSAGLGLVIVVRYTDNTLTQKFCTLDTIGFVSVTSTAGKSIKRLELSYGSNRTIYLSNMQLEEGSTDTSYEPYTGQTYPITFPSEAGTVYGGTLDVVNGTLTVTMAEVDFGTLTWGGNGTDGVYGTVPLKKSGSQIALCSAFKQVAPDTSAPLMPNASLKLYSDNDHIAVKLSGITSSNAQTMLSGAQFVYELAEPITYQLTPTEVQMLLGTNNIWADTGDILEGKYWSKKSSATQTMLSTLHGAREITETTPEELEEPEENDER